MRLLPVIKIAISAFLVYLSLLAHNLGYLDISGVSVSSEGIVNLAEHPVVLPSTTQQAEINLSFNSRIPGLTQIEIFVDDCLLDLRINDLVVSDISYPSCIYPRYIRLQTKDYIRDGANKLSAKILNYSGQAEFMVTAGLFSLNMIILRTISFVLMICFAWLILKQLKFLNPYPHLNLPVLTLIALRIIYFFGTKPGARDYDSEGHLSYVNYLLTNFTIPSAYEGWETWQPPLYYALSAIWVSFLSLISPFQVNYAESVQGLSLLLSIITIFSLAFICVKLFPSDNAKIARTLFLFLAGLYPGLFMMTARINNDALLNTLTILTIALVLRWFERPQKALWALIVFTTSLAFLTKYSAVILMCSICIAPLLLYERSLRDRLKLSILTGFCLVAINSWYVVYRVVYDNQNEILANLDIHDSRLFTEEKGITTFLTYNPIAVISIPFVSSRDDRSRRVNFFEYYVRSSLFGEFQYEKEYYLICRIILIFLNFMLVIGMVGLALKGTPVQRKLETFLMLFAGLAIVIHLFLRFRTPIPALADFRYTSFIIVPISFFWARSLFISSKSMREFFITVMGIFCFLLAIWNVFICLDTWRYSQVF